ncbi:MAG: hypothetical protein ABIE68_00470 [bacterium]
MFESKKIKVFVIVTAVTVLVSGLFIMDVFGLWPDKSIFNSDSKDSDNDGLANVEEEKLGTNPYLADTDEDGISDGEEVANNSDPLKVTKELSTELDEDGDGLTYDEEMAYGTDPKLPDSDYDGYYDGIEIATGHSPISANANKQDVLGDETLQSIQNMANLTDLTSIEGGIASMLETAGVSPEEVSLPNIPDSEIKIIESSSTKDIQTYLGTLVATIGKYIPADSEEGFYSYLSGFSSYNLTKITDMTERMRDTEAEIRNITVPRSAVSIHKKLLGITSEGQKTAAGLSATSVENDPYTYLSGLYKGQALFSQLNSLVEEMSALASANGFDLPLTLN